jgi:cupin fold WbuC family metalloprotein
MTNIERIEHEGDLVALIVRHRWQPEQTGFVTDNDANLQLGFVVYRSGGEIQPHIHHPLERSTIGTAEVLIVRHGRCEVDFFSDDKRLLSTRELTEGDVMLLLRGGHGFRIKEDTVFLEVKQGPYQGVEEKERFQPE